MLMYVHFFRWAILTGNLRSDGPSFWCAIGFH